MDHPELFPEDESGVNIRELFKAHGEVHQKYTYLLTAAAGAGITLVLNQTHDKALSLWELPAGMAVLFWGLSFYVGIRYLGALSCGIQANAEYLERQAGERRQLFLPGGDNYSCWSRPGA